MFLSLKITKLVFPLWWGREKVVFSCTFFPPSNSMESLISEVWTEWVPTYLHEVERENGKRNFIQAQWKNFSEVPILYSHLNNTDVTASLAL